MPDGQQLIHLLERAGDDGRGDGLRRPLTAAARLRWRC